MCIWRVQVRDLKAGAARLATLGGDDPLAAALQAGPPAGFAQPASRRRAAAANSDGGFGRGGRFNRSPIFNKPAANARKHTWDEDEEDEIEDDEEEGGDPYSFAGSTDGNNQSGTTPGMQGGDSIALKNGPKKGPKIHLLRTHA